MNYNDPANHVFQEDDDEGKDPRRCALCSNLRAEHQPESWGGLTEDNEFRPPFPGTYGQLDIADLYRRLDVAASEADLVTVMLIEDELNIRSKGGE